MAAIQTKDPTILKELNNDIFFDEDEIKKQLNDMKLKRKRQCIKKETYISIMSVTNNLKSEDDNNQNDDNNEG